MINSPPMQANYCDRSLIDRSLIDRTLIDRTGINHETNQIVQVPKGSRWQVYTRLCELQIPCACPEDGTLRVVVDHAIALLLVRSTVQCLTASRQELLDWLERCWQTQ